MLKIDAEGVIGVRLNGWEITSCHQPILSNAAIEKHAQELGFTVPEMIFGDNYLKVRHLPTQKELSLRALDALRLVDTGPDSASVQVSIARDWSHSRRNLDIAHVKPFDWTFTTKYHGSASRLEFAPTASKIDYERLKQREEILFYDENVLFEDDLGDNGTSQLSFKVRVMPSGFFILLRFFLRVDGVLFRIFDTRFYHQFGSDVLLREVSSRQASFDEVRRLVPRKKPEDEDLSLLNNIQFVDGVIGSPSVKCDAAVI
ncbi:Tap42 interacting protein [Coemansia sp. RSA 989]|nr:TIP41-like protein [Coemansia mojavensis]KAJ1740620.1 Tap42 interacting protein [Coemansia sp. RSA 1086]KAJ1748968.1 Tap42 interacting protein [Coemansia sp. RSA 1821]KAJ1863153.1 Tap42 interacting protein [Coemansia sp. RSA 989]KAJ1870931.1 Tap42 interacting protein [Coemansia sp. RSA 990]KAJ2632021.1 Tap42 interacting protein [Coemansia sp. RSA 1290]KAJ2646729.1 Tap42 interacting protein [Coemansia sp. RSA 1250]KAJ2668526.1 Tap42 interacting protein [Coemansia sp. RSA 1085]